MIENPMVNDRLWAYRNNDLLMDDEEVIEETVKCCICGEELWLEDEEAIPSEKFEDTYVCFNRTCSDKHYQGWSESMELQKYYIKAKKHSSPQ